MNFISPFNLLYFLPLAALIILLYLLKLKRKELVVSSTLLWQQALRDLQANAPIQKLRKNLLLFLQLLILLFVVVGVARPYMSVRALAGENVAVILDASASMKATDVGPSRFEAARKEALRMVETLGAGDKMMVIEASTKTRVLTPFTSDKRALKDVLARVQAKDTTSNLRESIVLSLSLIKGQRNASVYILSDGAVDPIKDLRIGGATIKFVKFGSRADNLAITALDVRRSFTSANEYQIFVTVQNFSDREREINLELLHDSQLAKVRPMKIPAKQSKSEVFDNLGFDSGVITARFDLRDDLASDNIAHAELLPRQSLAVLLVTNSNLALEKVLAVDPHVNQDKTGKLAPADYTPEAASKYDVVLFDNYAPSALPSSNYMLINAAGAGTPVQRIGTFDRPGVVDWDKKHPVTRYLNLADLRIARCLAVQVADWGKAVADSDNPQAPLIVVGEKGNRRVVYLGFDIKESDLWLRVAFPIFISNAVRWLASGAKTQQESVLYRAGDVVPLNPPMTVETVTITDPLGRAHTVEGKRHPLLFDGADTIGIYQVKAKNYQQKFAVSLLNKRESDILPRNTIELGSAGETATAGSTRANKEIWRWLIVLALVGLGLEWWVYHRGA
jgi:hypothetical protein